VQQGKSSVDGSPFIYDALLSDRLRSSSVWVLAIACSIAVAGIAISIALNTSALCITGHSSEKSLRCTTLHFHFGEQSLVYMSLGLN